LGRQRRAEGDRVSGKEQREKGVSKGTVKSNERKRKRGGDGEFEGREKGKGKERENSISFDFDDFF
jgi:hypothetical protein